MLRSIEKLNNSIEQIIKSTRANNIPTIIKSRCVILSNIN